MQQPHGMMLPFPFPMGVAPTPTPRDTPADRVPTRVLVAKKFVDELLDYSRTIVAAVASDSNTEIDDFQNKELTLDLIQARAAACDLLVSYFKGEFKPADWETAAPQPEKNWQMISCIACGATGRAGRDVCPLCKGGRNILCTPANPEGV